MYDNYSCVYQGDYKIYSISNDHLEISGDFLFKKLEEFGCGICTFSYDEKHIDLYGTYPRSKFIKIKKFIYDEYPYTSNIEPRKYGLRIYFKIKSSLI